MIETSLLAGQLVDPALQQGNGGQPLPSAQEKDVGRFQDIMTSETNATTAIEPQSFDNNDSSVLQVIEPGQGAKEAGLIDNMIEQATKMDSTYHSMLEDLGSRPGINDYINNQKDAIENEMMTYPQVNNGAEKSDANPYEATLERMEDVNNATLQYQSDMNQWAMGFRMWSTGIEVIASAAKKVSQGFQTLFRASG